MRKALSHAPADALRSGRLVLAEVLALPRWARGLAVVLLVAAFAVEAPRGGPGAMIVTVIGAAIVVAVAWAVADERDRRWVIGAGLLAFLARDMLVGAVDVALLSRGLNYYAPDETIYISRAFTVWQHWLDPATPMDESDTYLSLWYVHGMARLYLVFGENLVVVKLVNTLLAVVAALLCYRVMRNLGMPGARWALVLILAFPSIAFWSALTLKDSYVIFFLVASLWTASEFVRSGRPLWLVAALLVLAPLASVRLYMFVTGGLALLAIPFAISGWRRRFAVSGGLLAGLYVAFALTQPFHDLGPNVFWIPIELRAAVAQGARSSFVEPKPVINGKPGDEFQVTVSGVTPSPNVSPHVVDVAPGTAIYIQGSSPPPLEAGKPTPAVVKPGDIIRIATSSPAVSASSAPAASSPAASASSAQPSSAPPASSSPTASVAAATASPVATAIPVVRLDSEAKNTVGLSTARDPDEGSIEGSIGTNVRHLPIGVLFTLFAPFPWTARTLEQLVTIPEMLLWYACLVAAVIGFVVLLRRRDTRYAHGVAAIIGLTIVLGLIGGNVGTLIRSRAMLVPYVLLLSGVGIEWLLERYPAVGGRWRARLLGPSAPQSPS